MNLSQAQGSGATGRLGRRILLVEDHADTRAMYALILRDRGHDVSEAGDGPGALETMRCADVDVVIVDIGLPGMDGFELAREIRADETFSQVVLIAVTGHGSPEHRGLSRAAGFDMHIVKPVSPTALLTLLDTLPGRRPS
jgi:DNA-binding response OmpR family regulator